MSDMDKELRDMLRNKADDVVIETDLPAEVLKRSRRRRVLNAALAGGLAVLVVAGGFVGASTLLTPANEERPGGKGTTAPPPPAGEWPDNTWPQETREQAEAAQAATDEGFEDHRWQLAPRSLLYRYGQEIKGWERVFFTTAIVANDGRAQATISDCAEPVGEDQGGACEYVAVTAQQLLGTGEGMLWFVTNEQPGTPGGGGADLPSEQEARTTVNEIMSRRLEGASVDQWLTTDSEAMYESHTNGLYLYDGDHPNGEPQVNWIHFQIVSLQPADGTWDALVRVQRAGFEGSGGYFEERMNLGAGLNVLGEQVDLLIRSAINEGGQDGETHKQCQQGSPTPVRDCARSFMQTRLDGAGAEFYMTPDARGVYDDPNNQLHLYGTPYEDSGNFDFQRYEILGIRAADGNSYEVDVRLHVVAEGGPLTIFETLFVGPGRNDVGELQDFVIRDAEGHYED